MSKKDEKPADNPVLDDLEAKRSAPADQAMDPEAEAKRSGPPPTTERGSKPMTLPEAVADKKAADAKAKESKPAPDAAKDDDDAPRPMIEDLLKDKTFDHGGKVRAQLADMLMHGGVGQRAPAHLVTADGKAIEQPE